jgi:tRNA (guanine-N7-)-methyltransferase
VTKSKLHRFAELETFPNVIQPPFSDVFRKEHFLKGKWHEQVFRNTYPLVVELGCGKGEYAVGLAQKFPEKNFIGIDIKGARMWKGAKYALEQNISNVRFLRTRIEFLQSFFIKDEVSEIWLTFPDPQMKKRREKKRLSGPAFLNLYREFLIKKGLIHLKTDNLPLYQYTLQIVRENGLELLASTNDLYHSCIADEVLSIRTFYENMFLAKGIKIMYLKFRIDGDSEIIESNY